MPNKGDLIFVHGRDFISRAIEWVTHSKWSHVAIYIGNGAVIEAQGNRTVGFQRLSYYDGEYEVVACSLTPSQAEDGIMWLTKQIGRPYDYWDIFVLFVRCLFGLKIPWHEGHRVLCSRLARDFLFAAHVDIPDADMTPEDLYEWVIAHGAVASA